MEGGRPFVWKDRGGDIGSNKHGNVDGNLACLCGKWKVESGSECLAPERDKLNPIKVSQLTMGNKVGGQCLSYNGWTLTVVIPGVNSKVNRAWR